MLGRFLRTLIAMVIGVVLGAGVLLGVSTPSLAAPASRPAPARAMWIWQAAAVDDVVGWATAHGVRDLFVGFPGGTADLSWFRALRTRADRAGLTMAALGGDPAWATDPAAATRWADSARRTNLFSGLHIDVEPYLLPAWNTDRATVLRKYTEMLSVLRSQPLPVEYDVPFWYATVAAPGGGNLADAVLAQATRLTVLTYRNTVTGPNSLLDVGRDMLARAASRSPAGFSIRLAIETQPLADCSYCTYVGARQGAVTAALADIDRLAGAYPVYAGVAVHHYQAWRALRS